MTDTDVAILRKGDRVTDGEFVYEVTADARWARSQTHHEAWAVSPGGGQVVRVTYSGPWERAVPFRLRERTPAELIGIDRISALLDQDPDEVAEYYEGPGASRRFTVVEIQEDDANGRTL